VRVAPQMRPRNALRCGGAAASRGVGPARLELLRPRPNWKRFKVYGENQQLGFFNDAAQGKMATLVCSCRQGRPINYKVGAIRAIPATSELTSHHSDHTHISHTSHHVLGQPFQPFQNKTTLALNCPI
jgi:hypothetical protein